MAMLVDLGERGQPEEPVEQRKQWRQRGGLAVYPMAQSTMRVAQQPDPATH